MKTILESFKVTEDEYRELEKAFGQLCYYAAWQLSRKNTKNNHQNDIDDFQQELLISVVRAGSYYKRQVYIEKSLEVCRNFALDPFMCYILNSLQDLWNNRTRHGANRQKFGRFQEKLLRQVMRDVVPKKYRPSRKQPLKIDPKFATYCKQIIWNAQRSMGKRITREKPLRSGQVSLSEFDYLVSC